MLMTVGHSTRTIEQLLELLRSHGVEAVVDIRTVPKSRAKPQFAADALANSLAAAGELEWRHVGYLAPSLGTFRTGVARRYRDWKRRVRCYLRLTAASSAA